MMQALIMNAETSPQHIMYWHMKPFNADDRHQRESWRELAVRGSGSAVLLPEFVFTCAETLGGPGLRFACYGTPERPTAIALLDLRDSFRPEVFVASQMPLGAWIQDPETKLEQVCATLIADIPLALQFSMRQLDPRLLSRPAAAARVDTLDYIRTAWVELDGNFEDYWAARGKNLRANVKKQRNRMTRESIAARMEVLTQPDDMTRAVADYAALESRGWKAAEGTAVSEEHPQFEFYRRMLQRFSLQGKARVYRYFFGDTLVACELCVCHGDEMVILKTTHDESVHPFSPATLLREEMFESLFREGEIRRVEFYGPLKEWHTRWTDRARDIYHVNFYRNALAGMAVRALRKAKTLTERPEPTSAG